MNFQSQIKSKFPAGFLTLMQEAGTEADKHNLGAVVVGGVVRDFLLDKPLLDMDIMLEYPAQSVVETLVAKHEARLVTHDRFKTFTLHFPSGLHIDITSARQEIYEAPAKLPTVKVSREIKIEDDLKRRDFTVNTMALWLNKNKFGHLLDPFHGEQDLNKKVIRMLHDQSFVDDPTRIFRAARFAGRYDFTIESHTEQKILESLAQNRPALLSAARLRHEFERIMKEENPVPALTLLTKWNAIKFFGKDWKAGSENLSRMKNQPSPNEPSLFVKNLANWFSYWGKEEALLMMTDLGFEKKVKKEILPFLATKKYASSSLKR